MTNRGIAVLTGWALVVMTIIAGFSFGYAFNEFYQPDKINSLKETIANNQGLYISMLTGISLIVILDLIVSYTLYAYFCNDNNKIATTSAILRIIYTAIFGLATFSLANNLTDLSNEIINQNFQLFQTLWYGGLILFGCHLILIGVLMKLHRGIPNILWILALIAGISYIIVHLLKLSTSDSDFVTTLAMILALPMAIGEIALAIWLLLKGGNERKIEG